MIKMVVFVIIVKTRNKNKMFLNKAKFKWCKVKNKNYYNKTNW